MAKIIKRLCLPVGSFTKEGEDKPKIEYRDIGVIMEFESKDNKWQEVRLNADILNPSLFQLARQMMDRGSSSCRVKLFDAQARKQAEKPKEGAAGGAEVPAGDDDDIPF